MRLARDLRPAAITLDVVMPKMDGWSVLETLKADPILRDIPVVMLTMVDDKSRGFAVGASDYRIKPVDRAELLAVLFRYGSPDGRGAVLLIEDDLATRQTIARALRQADWQILEAGNGREGLDELARQKPSCGGTRRWFPRWEDLAAQLARCDREC